MKKKFFGKKTKKIAEKLRAPEKELQKKKQNYVFSGKKKIDITGIHGKILNRRQRVPLPPPPPKTRRSNCCNDGRARWNVSEGVPTVLLGSHDGKNDRERRRH